MGDARIPSLTLMLKKELRSMKYTGVWSDTDVMEGKPEIFVILLNFAFTQYSQKLFTKLIEKYTLINCGSNYDFVSTVYKILSNEFSYRPKISAADFMKAKFASHKIQMMIDICKMVKSPRSQ